MVHEREPQEQRDRDVPVIPHSDPVAGSLSLEASMRLERNPVKRFLKMLGPGLITGCPYQKCHLCKYLRLKVRHCESKRFSLLVRLLLTMGPQATPCVV